MKAFTIFPTHVYNYRNIITEGLHQTGAVTNGIIKETLFEPDWSKCEMVYTGPQIFVANPLYKTSRTTTRSKADFDTINLNDIPDNFTQRSKFKPILNLTDYKNIIPSFDIEESKSDKDSWFDYYKVAFREMLCTIEERTLKGCIMPPNCCHINTVVSILFRDLLRNIEFAGLTSSLPLDFYLKVIGAANFHGSRISSLPLGISDKYKSALFSRTLLLNCLTRYYSDLWGEVWRDDFRNQTWSIDDPRLKPFAKLQRNWTWDTPLRNYFERRQALVEIDVIAAMALGLSLQDLEMIYTIQFPVLQQNENDTWYDRKGNIVFTCSKGLTGVGVDRPQWDQIRNMQEGETYVHTIEKSELYRGQQVTYYAPFTKCDRIEDYRTAWTHFDKEFADK